MVRVSVPQLRRRGRPEEAAPPPQTACEPAAGGAASGSAEFSSPPLPLLFSFLFFRRCQPWARSPFLPEWGFTPTAGRRWAHFDGGNETTALSLSVRSFHSALARQTLAQGLAWKKWPEIDGIYSFPGLAERSGKNIPESVTEILQSSISGAAISCGRRKMGSTRSYMENKHTGASCQIQLIL